MREEPARMPSIEEILMMEPPPVEILLSASRNRVEVAVLDRGEGVPAGAGDKIFDPFFTVKISGSGVGLYISKHFVEAVGGELKIQDRKDGGSEARIVLLRGNH